MPKSETVAGPLFDCESVESTYESIRAVAGISREELVRRFVADDLDARYGREAQDIPWDEFLYREVLGDAVYPSARGTCWFHLTRAFRGQTFEAGLLPLHEALNEIWTRLGALQPTVVQSDWVQFRSNMGSSHNAHLYRMKAQDHERVHSGPYAFPVLDVAFGMNGNCDHYLRAPEIVEDIILAFRDVRGVDMMPAYLDASQPCIVKFWDPEFKAYTLRDALCYLYAVHRGEDEAPNFGCFDGKGRAVPSSRILRLDLLPFTPEGELTPTPDVNLPPLPW